MSLTVLLKPPKFEGLSCHLEGKNLKKKKKKDFSLFSIVVILFIRDSFVFIFIEKYSCDAMKIFVFVTKISNSKYAAI